MKLGILTREEYVSNGLQTFERNVVPHLHENRELETAKVHYPKVRNTYPFSRTIQAVRLGTRMNKRIEKSGSDVFFVPAQNKMQFNPEKTDAKVVPYVHDLMPINSCYPMRGREEKRLPIYVKKFKASRYVMNLKKCEKVLCGSQKVKNVLNRFTDYSGEAKVVYQGVDDKPLIEEDLERDIDLIYCGSTMTRKDPDFLQRAMGKAQAQNYAVADVNYKARPIEERIPGKSYVGISDEKLSRLFRRSRYYLHASLNEGFGRPPVEAQKQGCIPLARDFPINREVLGEKGKAWIPINSVEDVLEALKDRKGSRKAARENAERFKWSKTRERIKEELTG